MSKQISYIDELKSFIEKEGFKIRKAAKLGEIHYSNLFYILNGQIDYNSDEKKRKFKKFASTEERCKFILGKLIKNRLEELETEFSHLSTMKNENINSQVLLNEYLEKIGIEI